MLKKHKTEWNKDIQKRTIICDICSIQIPVEHNGWNLGNNAEPVVKDGRCCNKCNELIVIPRRINDYLRESNSK